MKTSKIFRAAIVAMTCLGVCIPHPSVAAAVVVDGIQINQQIEDLSLQNGLMVGGLVDKAGRGVSDAPVVIAQQGKPVATLRTDAEGRFSAAGLKPGIYQVVSHGALNNYRVWEDGKAPANAKRGVIHQVDPEVARGASTGGLIGFLTNPLVIVGIVAAAIAIPIALDDDDDAS